MLGVAATNLSFLFEREGELQEAEKYAQKAVQLDRYNAKAMNNLGNCYFRKGTLNPIVATNHHHAIRR